MKQKRKLFLLTDLIRRWENDLQTVIGVANPIVCGAISPIKCSFIAIVICEPYITDDVRTSLLRIVPVEIRSHNYTFVANLVKHFSFPNYISLWQTNLRTIEIDIRAYLGKKFHSNSERWQWCCTLNVSNNFLSSMYASVSVTIFS